MAPSKEVATTEPDKFDMAVTDDEFTLSGISSYEDAMRLLESEGVTTTIVGDGFYPLDKDSLVGVPFVVLGGHSWFSKEYGTMVCALKVATQQDVRQGDGSPEPVRKGIIIDGGTGIYKQAENYARAGRLAGLVCPKGLTRSEYDTVIDGKSAHGVTFYLS
jgi:hypothetical protein